MDRMNQKNQYGFVSIITVITLSILITLITTAFVRVMASGQRQNLDSQLSTQAYYAAETGVNDALRAIIYNPTAITSDDKDCAATPTTEGGPVPNQTISTGTTTVMYTCQLITSGTKDILMTAGEGVSKTFPIYTETSANSITVEWEDDTNVTGFNTGNAEDFPNTSNWKGSNGKAAPAMIRITIYQPGNQPGNNVSASNLINTQRNYFIKPGVNGNGGGNGEVSYNDPDGKAALANCNTISTDRPYACRITIKDITGTSVKNGVFIKIQPVYRNTKYRVTASPTAGYSTVDALPLFGAQYRIDVTGRANDVYRRLEVRLPLAGFTSPSDGVDSASICKNFQWNGSSIVGANPCSY